MPKLFTSIGLIIITVVSLILIADNVTDLFLLNTLLGLPVTISVLVLSYIYEVWRLKKLGGPGIEEYRQSVPRPWKGQRKGF